MYQEVAYRRTANHLSFPFVNYILLIVGICFNNALYFREKQKYFLDSDDLRLLGQKQQKQGRQRVIQYEKIKIKQLEEQHQIGIKIKQSISNQIDVFKEKLKQILDSVPLCAQKHISSFICQYNLDEPLFEPLTKTKFQHIDMNQKSSIIGFERPIPQFIAIDPSELTWIFPGIITDVKYDFSNEFIQEYNQGETRQLTKSEKLLFEQLLPSQITLILTNSSFFISKFTGFFSFNPQISLTILQYIGPQKVSQYFYDKLINIEVNKSTLQSMKKLIFQQQLPKMTINYYIIKTMQKCQQIEQSQQQGLARMIVAFLKQLIKAKKVQIKDIEQEIRSFGIKFSHIEEVAKFYKIVVQTNN